MAGDFFNGWPEDGEPVPDKYERIEREIKRLAGVSHFDVIVDCEDEAKSMQLLLDVARALDVGHPELLGNALTALKEHCDE